MAGLGLWERFRRGAQRGAARNIGSIANLVDVGRRAGNWMAEATGLPAGGGVAGPLSEYLRRKQSEYTPPEETEQPDLLSQTVEGIGQGLVELPRFLGAGRLLGSPVVGAAAAAAAPELHRGAKEAAKEAAIAAAGAKIVQTFAKMPPSIRRVVEGTVDATQAAVAGGSPQDITAAVLTGRVMSAAGERGPSTVKKPSTKYAQVGEVAGRVTRELALDTSGQVREPSPPERRSFQPKSITDLTDELGSGDYVILTGTREAVGDWDHPANLGANKQLDAELRQFGYNPVKIPDSYSEGIRQGESFHVPGMTVDEGVRFAKKYGQQSILVGRGGVAGLLNVENGNWTPIDLSQTTIGPAAAQQPFFSVVQIGDNLVPFSMKANFEETRPFNAAELGATKPSTTERPPQRSPEIDKAALEYVKERGLPEVKYPAGYHKQPEKVLSDIADSYQAAVHDPEDPAISRSYQDFAAENVAQWKFATEKMGMKFEPWNQEGRPYNNSAEMIQDATQNKHLYFFAGGDLPPDHPMAQPSGISDPSNPMRQLTNNEVFRAVHDLFGHAKGGFQFGPRGEYNAFLSHYQMYGPVARSIALVNETLAQNAWENYGRQVRERAQGTTLTHFSGKAGLTTLEPSFHGTGAPDAALRRGGRIPRTYYYGAGAQIEPFFGPRSTRPHRYQAEIQPSRVYDLNQDPLGLRERAGADAGKLEELIRDAGFSGYMADIGRGPTYAIFEPLPAQQVESAGVALPQRPTTPLPAERPIEKKAVRLAGEPVAEALRPVAGTMERPLAPEEIARLPRPQSSESAAYQNPELLPEAAEPTVAEVARRLEGVTKKIHGETLPNTPEERTAALVRLMRREIPEQLALTPEAAEWYGASVQDMMTNLRAVEPSLGKPNQEPIFTSILAVMSNGTEPRINLEKALDAYREYQESGQVPSKQSDGSNWPARNIELSINKINNLIAERGEAGAVKFLTSKQTKGELLRYANADVVRKGVIFDDDGKAYGAYVFGPKLGAFFLDLNGIHEVTVDRWAWRTAGRAWGDLVHLDKSGQWQIFEPQGLSYRAAFKKAVEKVAKDFGLKPQEIQALQWYAEKGLYEKHGAGEEAQSFGEESRRIRETHEQRRSKKNSGSTSGGE